MSETYMGCTVWVRFHANEADWRPVKFPPPGPCWCTGYGDGYATVVAWLPKKGWRKLLKEHWPEATNIDMEDRPEGPQFSGRFPKPDWGPQIQPTTENTP